MDAMNLDLTVARPAAPPQSARRLRPLGRVCTASGLIGIAVAVLTAVYPAAVPSTQWSFPFSAAVQWPVGLVLALTHVLTVAGFLGVLAIDPHRGSRVATAGLRVAVVGLAVLAGCELASAAIGGQSNTSGAAEALSAAFGVSSLLVAAGSIAAGVVIARQRWGGPARWALLASGIILVLVTPAQIIGDLDVTMVALGLWSLALVLLGRAISSTPSQ